MLFWACKNEKIAEQQSPFSGREMVLLDSTRAAQAILDDDETAFFEQINRLDMALQMQRRYSSETPRAEILADYQTFLQQDVANFSESEAVILQEILSEIRSLCYTIAPDIFPKTIELIKTKGRHYGDGVFYTRENRIIIPANELAYLDRKALREVLIHEIFHIYARQHSRKRTELYALIGFSHLQGKLLLPSEIRSRLLLNPDGVDMAYVINLAMANADTALCVPILTANAPAYLPERKAYFEYIDFNLYPVRELADGSFVAMTDSLGRSPIRVNEQPDFFRQIGDNTFYIIHPDEILADNFKWLVLSQTEEKADELERFSEEGQELLQQIKAVLQK